MSDWTPWTEHDGKGCPIPVGTIIEVEGRNHSGRPANGVARVSERDHQRPSPWHREDMGRLIGGKVCGRILRYRVRRYAKAARCMEAAIEAAERSKGENA